MPSRRQTVTVRRRRGPPKTAVARYASRILTRSRESGIIPLSGEWDNPTMIVTLDAKRRLTVPTGLAPASPGDYFDASFDAEEDALVFRRLPGKENWLAVLKAC